MTKQIFLISLIAMFALFSFSVIVTYININQKATFLKEDIVAKENQQKTNYDAMWKRISQIAQVNERDRQDYMTYLDKATSSGMDVSQSTWTWLKQTYPNLETNLNSKTTDELLRAISEGRDRIVNVQDELILVVNEYNKYIKDPWRTWALSSGFSEIKANVITSSRTENAAETGIDDDVKVFQ